MRGCLKSSEAGIPTAVTINAGDFSNTVHLEERTICSETSFKGSSRQMLRGTVLADSQQQFILDISKILRCLIFYEKDV